MHLKNIKCYAFFLCILSFSALHAQESINTASGEAAGNGGTSSFTVGQVFYNHYGANNYIITEGVQQPYEISKLLVANVDEVALDIVAYPNPTTHYLQLDVKNIDIKNLSFELYNAQGALLQAEKLESHSKKINMNHLPVGLYYLTVKRASSIQQTFKVLKK